MLGLVSCGTPASNITTPAPSDNPALITPYLTATPARTAAPTTTAAPSPTPPPLPTATPYLYTIVESDTMIGIASYFGITLDELTLANPDVNPNFLSVGTQLVIPLPEGEDQPDASASSEPDILPVQTGELSCTPNQLGGMWCFWPVTNTLEQPVENLAGLVRLYDQAGEEVRSQTAYSLTNVLQPGEQIPLAVYFQPPLPEWETSQAQLSSAASANQVGERYFSTEVASLQAEPLDEDQLGYQVSGTLRLSSPSAEVSPAYAWVVAIAYDQSGQIVGLRRWEASADVLGAEITFSFEVFSLGEPIDRVEVLAEARTD